MKFPRSLIYTEYKEDKLYFIIDLEFLFICQIQMESTFWFHQNLVLSRFWFGFQSMKRKKNRPRSWSIYITPFCLMKDKVNQEFKINIDCSLYASYVWSCERVIPILDDVGLVRVQEMFSTFNWHKVITLVEW